MRRPYVSKFALVWVGFAVSALFTYLSLRNVHFGQVWDGLRASNYWWTIPSVAVLGVSLVIRSLRWQFLFAAQTRPPYGPVLGATILGQLFNNILPARAGEAARVIALNRTAGTSRAETVGTVVVERVFDVLVLLVLLFVGLPWLPQVTWLRAAEILAIALTAATVVAIVLLGRFGDRPFRFLLRPLARLPFVSVERTEQAASGLLRGAASLRHPGLAVVALSLTAVSWVLLGISAWLLMLGFHLGLSPLGGMLVIVAVGLSAILPSSPAAVGVFEAATLVALNAYGISKERALSYALVLHVINSLPYIAAGIVVLQVHAVSLRRRAG